MVFLALTRSGYEELCPQLTRAPSPLWVSAGVLSEQEIAALRSEGVEVTNFSHVIDTTDRDAVEAAIASLREHHPSERLWVEYAPNL
jgi:hypothetical protein